MVENKTTIAISSLIALGLIIASTVTFSYFDNPKYYCESKSSILECSGGLSGGSGTRCYLNTEKSSWTTCSEGWLKITNDLNIQENETINNLEPAYSGDIIQYSCNQVNCTRIK
jgi:hypothetical protein